MLHDGGVGVDRNARKMILTWCRSRRLEAADLGRTGKGKVHSTSTLRTWFKSSRSNPGGCVEVCYIDDGIKVRDSKDPCGPVLTFTNREWLAFLDGVRLNEFDPPAGPS